MKKAKSNRWTEEQALEMAKKLGQEEKVRKALATPTLSEALERLGLAVEPPRAGSKTQEGQGNLDNFNTSRGTKTTKGTSVKNTQEIGEGGAGKPAKKKRRGVDTGPIMAALKNSPARCRWGSDWIALDFPGGRLLSYNELYSILQYRKYEAFRYKKICREAIANALASPHAQPAESPVSKPYFDSPTRLTLVRQGAKAMDREALTVIFKYMTDALRTQGIIKDDNPDIIVQIQTMQAVGPERVAMRLDKVYDWVDPGVPQWEDWV